MGISIRYKMLTQGTRHFRNFAIRLFLNYPLIKFVCFTTGMGIWDEICSLPLEINVIGSKIFNGLIMIKLK